MNDIKCLEQVQRRASKLVDGLDYVDYARRLSFIWLQSSLSPRLSLSSLLHQPWLQSLENRRLRGDLIETLNIITGKKKVMQCI